MSSRSSSRLASPWWVALDAGAGAARAPPRDRPVSPSAVRGERASAAAPARPAPRLERASRRGSELAAAALLLVLWVALWAVFTAGVVQPAAAVHAGSARPGAAAAQAPVAATP